MRATHIAKLYYRACIFRSFMLYCNYVSYKEKADNHKEKSGS